MNLLPKASGTRPRVACEISPQGVVAARSNDAASPLAAVAKVDLAEGAVVPSLKPGNIADRVAVTAALRRAMEAIGSRPNSRGTDLTVIIPDAAVRVLLLEFDSFPSKLSEALPIVRFRLKKLLPFDADDAMISFQIMSSSKALVRVLAVAIPRDVLSDYETAVREAGFEPGAVLSSTLAAVAGVDDADSASLIVNASPQSITSAIVRGGVLMLHRSVDLQEHGVGSPANIPPALLETPSGAAHLPLVDREHSAAEWAAQEALPEHGRNPYADRAWDEAAVQGEDGITQLPVPQEYSGATAVYPAMHVPPGDLSRSPYAAGTVDADLNAELHNSVLVAPTSLGSLTDPAALAELRNLATAPREHAHVAPDHNGALSHSELAQEIAQAVSVATAYYEDTLFTAPSRILSAGPLGANGLLRILNERGIAQADGLSVRELVESASLLSDAVTSQVPRGWLAGVLGALRG